ncbi:MAG TPA: hypothetical protein VKE96_08445 [Vicinamibacterales bacterium]|nr:hypothetical protein [Vicinamibacterales bacterium]
MVIVIVQSRTIRRPLGVMRREVSVNRRGRVVVVAFVDVLRSERGSRAHDGGQHQTARDSNRPEHRAIMVRPILGGQTRR